MARIARYTLGAGGGVYLLALVGGQAWPQAAQLAGGAIGIGWLLWGGLALSSEVGSVAGGAARFAFDAAGAMFSRSDGDAENDGLNIAENETLPPAPATRFIRVNDKNGAHWLAVDDGPRSDYRRRLMSFVVLGERVGSWNFRDVQGRALSDSTRIDYDLWRRFTSDLKGARLFESKRGVGTRPCVDAGHCLSKLANGAGLWSDPEIILPGGRVV